LANEESRYIFCFVSLCIVSLFQSTFGIFTCLCVPGYFFDVKVLPLEALMCELSSNSSAKKGLGKCYDNFDSEYVATLRLYNSVHLLREDLACGWHQQVKSIFLEEF